MMMIDEVHQDHMLSQVRKATALPPIPIEYSKPSGATAIDMEQIDQTIRSAVSKGVMVMEQRLNQSMESRWREQMDAQADAQASQIIPAEVSEERMGANSVRQYETHSRSEFMQFSNMGEQMQNAFRDNAQHCQNELQEHSKRINAHGSQQAEALDAQAQCLDAQALALDVMLKKIDKLTGLVSSQAGDRCIKPDVFSAEDYNSTKNNGPYETHRLNLMKQASSIHVTPIEGDNGHSIAEYVPGASGECAVEHALVLDVPAIVQEPKEPKAQQKEKSMRSRGSAQTESEFWLERIVVSTKFEMVFGLMILLNTVHMCVEAEYLGWEVGHLLGFEEMGTTQASTEGGDHVFKIIELIFGAVFSFEVLVKMAALRCRFINSAWNVFDTVLIVLAWLTMFSNLELPVNPMLLRLLRLAKLLRLLRGLTAFEVCDDLQLMVRALQSGAPVLIWVVFLLGPAIACVALGMNYTLSEFIADDSKPMMDRIECYKYFGTFTKAMLSMFEVTFGNWVPICRFLHAKVDERFAIFFMCYQMGMGIACLRIIYGVFLHVTFRCATADEDLMIAQRFREEKRFAKQINDLFNKFDSSGDGSLSKDEFHEIAEDIRVKTLLSAMDLDIQQADLIFQLSCPDGKDELTAQEMVEGFSRLKGFARSTSVQELLHREEKAQMCIDKLMSLTHQIATKVGADMSGKYISTV